MCDRLNEVLTSARAVIGGLDPNSLTGAQVSAAFESVAELEKLAVGAKLLLAPKIAASETWARAGHRSPEEWMARASGTSVGQAKATVETGERLKQLPATASAVKAGALSLAQAAAVAEAAAADPRSESKLLETAGKESLKILQDKSRRVVLDSRGSVEERYERHRQLRMSKGTEVVVVVSRDSLLRGEVDRETGELCEVPGFGAIPVSRARQLMADCFLKGVLVDGTKIVTVKHFGRHRPAELDTALLIRSVLSDGQVRCKVEQCDQTAWIQWDHAQPWALGGPTSVDNLNPFCGFDNREKEAGRVVQTPDGRWVRTGAVAQTRNPP